MSLHIRLISGTGELQAVLRLRRQIYVEELGYRLPAAGEGPLHAEPLDTSGLIFGAFDNGELVGAVRVNYGRAGEPSGGFGFYAGFYGMQRFGSDYPEGISIVTRLMALPAHRSGAVMAQFGVALYEHTRDHEPQVRLCIIDCVPPLRGMFERIGYRAIGPVLQHPLAGPVLPMAFAVYHREHFQHVGSPLAAVCPRHDADAAAGFEQWLREHAGLEPAGSAQLA